MLVTRLEHYYIISKYYYFKYYVYASTVVSRLKE